MTDVITILGPIVEKSPNCFQYVFMQPGMNSLMLSYPTPGEAEQARNTLARSTYGHIMDDTDTWELIVKALEQQETLLVAQSKQTVSPDTPNDKTGDIDPPLTDAHPEETDDPHPDPMISTT